MGTAWLDGGSRIEKLQLIHRRWMSSSPRPYDKCMLFNLSLFSFLTTLFTPINLELFINIYSMVGVIFLSCYYQAILVYLLE